MPSLNTPNQDDKGKARFDDAEIARIREDGDLLIHIVSQDGVKLRHKRNEWVGLCPFHAEKTPSFKILPEPYWHFHCFGCQAHGSVFDYLMKRHNWDFPQTFEYIAGPQFWRKNGPIRAAPTKAAKEPKEDWRPIAPVPPDVPDPTPQQLHCDILHPYRDAGANRLTYIRRIEARDGKPKDFPAVSYGTLNGKTAWHPKRLKPPLPLYGLDLLAHMPTALILLMEGEKKAEAVNRKAAEEQLDIVGLSWMGGAGAVELADFEPLKPHEHRLGLWPDLNKIGQDAYAKLRKIFPRARTLDLSGLDEDFDAAELRGPLKEFLDQRLVKLPAPKWTAMSVLEGKHFMPLKWVLPGYIPEGCTLLAGKPKIGKSWFVLAVALAKAKGTEMLEQRCERCGVRYLALEDSERRMQDRASKLCEPGWPEDMFVRYDIPTLDGDAITELEATLTEDKSAGLLIIDTLARIQGKPLKNESPYAHDYRTVNELALLSRRTGVAIIIVHHVRKADAPEVFDAVLGTTGLTGAADTIVVMNRIDQGIRFSVRGRDVEEIDKILDFEPELGTWSVLGDYESDPEASNTRQKIIGMLAQAKYPMSPKDVAEQLGMPRVTVRKQLNRLNKDGKIKKASYGAYTL